MTPLPHINDALVTVPAVLTPTAPESEPWKTSHAELTVVRWSNGWVATCNMWRWDRPKAPAPLVGEALRTYVVQWPQTHSMRRGELIDLLWRSAMNMAHQADGNSVNLADVRQRSAPPGDQNWAQGKAWIIPGVRSSSLGGYLSAHGSTSRRPNESRILTEELLTLLPMQPSTMLATLSYLIEQHAH